MRATWLLSLQLWKRSGRSASDPGIGAYGYMLVKSFSVGNMYGSQIDLPPCHYSASQQTSTSSTLSPSFLVENSCHQMPTHTYHNCNIYKASDIRFFHSCCADNVVSKHRECTVLLPREHNCTYHIHCMSNRLLCWSPSLVNRAAVFSARST